MIFSFHYCRGVYVFGKDTAVKQYGSVCFKIHLQFSPEMAIFPCLCSSWITSPSIFNTFLSFSSYFPLKFYLSKPLKVLLKYRVIIGILSQTAECSLTIAADMFSTSGLTFLHFEISFALASVIRRILIVF